MSAPKDSGNTADFQKDLDAVLAFARRTIQEEKAVTAAIPANLPLCDAACRAALEDTFDASLPPFDGTDDKVRAVLAQTEIVMADGKRRLRLADETRARLIEQSWDQQEFQDELTRLFKVDRKDFDAISLNALQRPGAWLRAFLKREYGDLAKAPADELRAAVTALERLRFLTNKTGLPTIEEATRRLGLAELLEPLRILIGSSGGWDGSQATDRFAGRESELRDMRAFVDELDSQTATEAVSRSVKRIASQIASALGANAPGAMVWVARGGLGKTALMAKFVLDHALAPSTPFPFAYLDFDRGALQPRSPQQMLIEVAWQVALQFPDTAPLLGKLRKRLRDEIADADAPRTNDPFGTFREIVRGKVTEGRRAFLLVLDTMEVVQYDPAALRGVVAFVDQLFGSGFPELRVVAAGRADIPELRQRRPGRNEGQLKVLDSLPPIEAAKMADYLGQALLKEDWHAAWARRIAGPAKGSPLRREPLSIRVAVELLRSAGDNDSREALSREIELKGEDASQDFVAALYQRRILDHVRDDNVKALAWPGLVFRRITREIVRDALSGPCGLTPESAEAAFEGLAREVWIVQPTADGGLQHRPDLRARSLPLMRRHDPVKFNVINAAAIDYFARRQMSSPVDRVEWLYHRLLGGDSIEALERDWSDAMGSLLLGAEADLDPESPAAAFLVAMTSPRLLSAQRLGRLPVPLALEHVARTGLQLADFDDDHPRRRLVELKLEDIANHKLSGAATAALLALSVKTGRWRSLPPPSADPGSWRDQQEFAVSYQRARLGDSKVLAKRNWVFAAATPSPPTLRAMVEDLAHSRLSADLSDFDEIDERLAQVLASFAATRLCTQSMLRQVMIFGERSFGSALSAWLTGLTDKEAAVTLSLTELRILLDSPKQSRWFDRLANEVNLSQEDLLPQGPTLRLDHAMLPSLIGEIIETLHEERQTIRRFAAARDENWLTPAAYAATRGLGMLVVPPALLARLASHDPANRSNWLSRALRAKSIDASEMLQALRLADEAGDFEGTARLALQFMSEPARSDLEYLLYTRDAWRRRIDQLLGAAKE